MRAPSPSRPSYFTRADGQPLTFAAIHDTWTNRETNEKLRSVSMLIEEPNKFVREVHDRMPVILEAKDFEQWESGDAKDAAALMRPAARTSCRGGRCRSGSTDARYFLRYCAPMIAVSVPIFAAVTQVAGGGARRLREG